MCVIQVKMLKKRRFPTSVHHRSKGGNGLSGGCRLSFTEGKKIYTFFEIQKKNIKRKWIVFDDIDLIQGEHNNGVLYAKTMEKHFVQTNEKVGINEETVEKAMKLLHAQTLEN